MLPYSYQLIQYTNDLIYMHVQCLTFLHIHQITAYHVDICGDILGTNITKWPHCAVKLNASVK